MQKTLALYPVFVESYITTGKGLIEITFDLACIKLWRSVNCVPICLLYVHLSFICLYLTKHIYRFFDEDCHRSNKEE